MGKGGGSHEVIIILDCEALHLLRPYLRVTLCTNIAKARGNITFACLSTLRISRDFGPGSPAGNLQPLRAIGSVP